MDNEGKKWREGKNGGRLKVIEKGDKPNDGAGRPKGAKSFKKLLKIALNKMQKTKEGGEISLKEASVLQLVSMYFSKETDDNTKLRIWQTMRDTLDEAPVNKQEITGKDGTPLMPSFPTDITVIIDPAPITSYVLDADKTNKA